ncbi:class I SAM-dependent methyltransferase [Bradyrhizobium sp. HKCCYLS2038]|uniref:class I SAM-dependent methyltransferase n=1 Tax=unclassified Bradyrhizobium TaxID=2631580 RepID=UPI003EC12A28
MSDEQRRDQIERQVSSCYSTWADTYFDDYYANEKAYPPVHLGIVRDLLQAARSKTVLDAGCGPASMLRGLTDLDLDLYGFDLTPEMVSVAREVMASAGVPANRIWEGSVAEAADFARPGVTPDGFDAAICMGVFPHLSEEAEWSALRNLHGAVRPDGIVAIEARNELFGLFTLNRYSYDLFSSRLIRAADLRPQGGDQVALDQALEAMKERFRMDLPPVRGGKCDEPGYDQVLSRTHNPFVLSDKIRAAGFRDVRVLFYHYHCLPPMFEAAMPELFRKLSVAMENPQDWRGHFMASAFIVTGVRQ